MRCKVYGERGSKELYGPLWLVDLLSLKRDSKSDLLIDLWLSKVEDEGPEKMKDREKHLLEQTTLRDHSDLSRRTEG